MPLYSEITACDLVLIHQVLISKCSNIITYWMRIGTIDTFHNLAISNTYIIKKNKYMNTHLAPLVTAHMP